MKSSTPSNSPKRKKFLPFLVALALLLAGLCWYLHWQNTALQTSRLEFSSPDLPQGFDGFTIVQLSDFHSARFGEGQSDLLELVEDLSPDLIAVTGDLIDSYEPDLDASMELIDGCVDIAPVYYINGNHESRLPELYAQAVAHMEEAGVVILDSEAMTLERSGDTISLIGLSDPTFFDDTTGEAFANALHTLTEETEDFTLLLSHRPEKFPLYQAMEVDLTLSGHAHGGQIRLPFVGGLVAPGQGFFPELTEGIYKENNSALVVSRGLGNSLFPFRVNNRPEVVCVTLHTAQ